MEPFSSSPAGASSSGPLHRCRADNELPVRLVGESDVFALPANEEIKVEVVGAPSVVEDAAVQPGTRGQLTTHRFYWKSSKAACWLALRLDAIASVESTGGFFRSRGCTMQFPGGCSVTIRAKDAAVVDELVGKVESAIRAAKWKDGSYEAAAMGGLKAILSKSGAQKQAADSTLDLALSDLKMLRQHAAEATAVARRAATQSRDSADSDGVQRLLEDFGLIGDDGKLIASGGDVGRSSTKADVERACVAALEKRGGLGLLLAHDVFCLVNRARGTELVSPEEVMSTLRACSAPGGQLRLRVIGSTGAYAVSLLRTSDAEVDSKLLGLVDAAPVSAFGLAIEWKVTATEAQYLLHDAESREVLVRDDAPDGVYYYRNFFSDF